MTDTTATQTTATQAATPATAQNYVLYRTQADGWQQVGYVIMAMTLSGPTAFTPPAGMALGLDAEKAYPTGSIYAPAASATTSAATAAST